MNLQFEKLQTNLSVEKKKVKKNFTTGKKCKPRDTSASLI